jgi:D-xylose transport system ATP-binding protein
MNDVLQVSDRIAAMFLGRVAAMVDRKDVDQQTLVELITTGRAAGVNGTVSTRSHAEESS